MKKWKDYLLEGMLIVFSVLFALFIDNVAQNIKTQKQKELALERITQELERNAKVLNQWLPHHQQIYERLQTAGQQEHDTLKAALLKFNYFNIGVILGNQQLAETVLTNTAWETAKSTGIIAEFDFESIEHLTQVYALQNVIANTVLNDIIKFLFDPATHDLKNLDKTLRQLELRFHELTGQERLLAEVYKGHQMRTLQAGQ